MFKKDLGRATNYGGDSVEKLERKLLQQGILAVAIFTPFVIAVHVEEYPIII